MIIYAIPGFGTTAQLFSNITIKGAEFIVLNWPAAERGETMQSYAQKFLPQIKTSEPFCLLGVSFGGMLCSELCRLVKPQRTFLISSAKSRGELSWFLRLLRIFPIHKYINESMHRKLAYYSRRVIGFDKAYMPEFMIMVNSMRSDYFCRCIPVIINWNRTDAPENVIHLHGSDDRLILHSGVKANYTIDGGTHAMVVFRADEISKIVDEEIRNCKAK